MIKTLRLLASLVLLSLATGCGTIYQAAVDERDVKTFASDKYINTEITARFLHDDLVKVLDMGGKSYNGHVYVYGEIESEAQKQRALSIVHSISGVQSVTHYFFPKIENDPCGTSDNLLIRADLNKELIMDDRIWSTNIDIAVVRCNVVLMGIVGTQREAELAVKYASEIERVRRVKSYLKVNR